MIEKSLVIIIFMYAAGFSMLTAQYVLGDVYHVTMRNLDGDPIQSSVLSIIDTDNLNAVTLAIADATDSENSTLDAIENAFQLGYNVGKELLFLMTGTYIFNILYLFGIPPIFIAGIVVIYLFILGRTLIAYVRGV